MPRARNESTEQAIRAAAWQLFFDKGIAGTSYTDLAEQSGISRPLVQRYFPKKELLVGECVAAIRAAAVAVCDEAYPDAVSPLGRLYLRGQLNIATYFACEGLRKIMSDVLSSREITQQTIADGFRWTVAEVLPNRELAVKDEPDSLIMAMGGLYELIYTHLTRGTVPDIAGSTLPSVEEFGRAFALELPKEGLAAYAIKAPVLKKLANVAVERIEWR